MEDLDRIKGLSHDLNNLLTGILSSAEILGLKLKSQESLYYLAENIRSSALKAAEIVSDMLPRENSETKRKEMINAAKITGDIADSLRALAGSAVKIEASIKTSGSFPGFPTEVYRALLNIAMNAKEAGSSEIRISSYDIEVTSNQTISREEREGHYIAFSVSDNGPGVDPDHAKKIFEKGFSTKKKKTASGLGLHIVQEILRAHGGFIRLNSKAGGWTEFILAFPKAGPALAKGGKTILLADDDENIRETLAYLLESYEFNVIKASSGLEVLEIMEKMSPDLLVIDKNMPGLDGIGCLTELRKRGHKVKAILSSGSGDSLESGEMRALGISQRVSKPYDFELLLSFIQEEL